jgi:hypothetical protein
MDETMDAWSVVDGLLLVSAFSQREIRPATSITPMSKKTCVSTKKTSQPRYLPYHSFQHGTPA